MNTDFARRQMVQQQIRTWDVLDPVVLRVVSEVQREQFVPSRYGELAFADIEIPLPHGQAMMKPIVEGRLLQGLALRPEHNVLEIGTGTGFLTACLARLSTAVSSIDVFSDFIATAKSNLANGGIENVELLQMDATKELPKGRFDAVAVTGSMPAFDPRLIDALKPGGRLFVIVGDSPVMDARIVTRTGEHDWSTMSLFETDVRPLLNAATPPAFLF